MKPASPILRVLLSFGSFPDNTLITFANKILLMLYIAGFTDIPVTAAEFQAAIAIFSKSKADQPSGGVAATAEKDKQRAALLVILKKLASFVQEASNNDMAVLLSSGFQAMSLNRAPYPLSKPTILRIVTGMTGEALVTVSTERIARGCEIRVAEIGEDGAPGEFRILPFSTSSRNIAVTGLIPGKLYAYQGRTVGGSTTYSDWSDLLVQRAA
ncbi:MAG: hypothetical protein ABIS50_01175 [Luteolibacter sp.]|uniref:hypothetical protein n=1 Tax=Luteolibacter sp. TaxID=1962973 RepID=UPI003267DE35